jgi:hypothetical protein
MTNLFENVLILQGGGSLGAFGCGVFKALAAANVKMDIIERFLQHEQEQLSSFRFYIFTRQKIRYVRETISLFVLTHGYHYKMTISLFFYDPPI